MDSQTVASAPADSAKKYPGPNAFRRFLDQSFWWMWQIGLAFVVVHLINIANTHLLDALQLLKASYDLDSMSFPPEYNITIVSSFSCSS